MGGTNLRVQQSKVQDLRGMIDHANDRLTKAEVGRSKAEKDVEKLDKALKKNQAALEEVEAELNAA